MKRCRSISTNKIVLGLTSFFIFIVVGCGIPTYINLDGNISWQREALHIDGTRLTWTVQLDEAGIQKMSSVNFGPGIKFFYTMTSDSSKTVFGFDSLSVENRFNTYFRKSSSGNGLVWNAEGTAAPGFYLFTPKSSSNIAPLSIDRPDLADVDETKLRVLVGTFAMDVDTSGDFIFKDSPDMDLAIPKNTGTVSFTIRKPNPTTDDFIELLLEVGGNDIPLRNYIKNTFPVANESDLHIDNEDQGYFSYISNPSGEKKYLHIWASLYGGVGDFSNTYWSGLTYLGKIDL